MARDQRAVANFERISSADSMNEQMVIAGSDIRAARDDEVTIGGFADFDFAAGVEPACKRCRKSLGHVLDSNDAGTIGRHLFEYMKECFGSAGRGSDCDNSIGISAEGHRGDWCFRGGNSWSGGFATRTLSE